MKKEPQKIDDGGYFRAQMMQYCYELFSGEYRWHKIQNCPKCKAKKSIKPCLWGMPSAEVAYSGKYAIMGCSLEIPMAKWACAECDYKIYYPPDCLEREPK